MKIALKLSYWLHIYGNGRMGRLMVNVMLSAILVLYIGKTGRLHGNS